MSYSRVCRNHTAQYISNTLSNDPHCCGGVVYDGSYDITSAGMGNTNYRSGQVEVM